ncbi:MAG: aromatic ring-hydroxylating dioxygenase subunit alpha [Pyrinomonadaceae bacterium]|nr:aromatic ring-hydroxylating dioxygenase subunit alpha [Pyrinomonadaceae bacterium]
MSIFEINPDIRQAHTLSSEFYTNEKYFEQSKEKIFSRSWHLVDCFDDSVNLRPVNILETPILISNSNGEINCFSNVCTHRGAILVEENCNTNGIRCRYHGRRFDLQGKFLSMPEFENVENFPSEKDDLPQIPFGVWANFIFASLNPFATLDEFLAEMKQTVQPLKKSRLTAIKDYEVNAHWALYCENYLEGFHVPFVHQGLNSVIDYGTYTTETFRFSSLQTAFDDNGELAAHYFFIFPNLMFNFYPWGISVNIVKPITPSKTTVTYLTFVSDESKLGTGAGADLETVELEDQAVVESVQRGIRSRFYDSGRYSPTREQGTHHFHRLICEFMS